MDRKEQERIDVIVHKIFDFSKKENFDMADFAFAIHKIKLVIEKAAGVTIDGELIKKEDYSE